MKIEDNVLVIESELNDENASELLATIEQDSIEKIKIENDNISSSCLQILICAKKDKPVEYNSSFLEKIFTNISYMA